MIFLSQLEYSVTKIFLFLEGFFFTLAMEHIPLGKEKQFLDFVVWLSSPPRPSNNLNNFLLKEKLKLVILPQIT